MMQSWHAVARRDQPGDGLVRRGMFAESLLPDPSLFDADLAIAGAVTLVAGLMRGFAGFGSAMAMAPVFAILFGPAEMVVMIMLMELGVTVQLFPGAVRDAQWRFVGPMGLAAGLAMPFGSYILVTIDPELLSRLVAAVVLAFVLFLISGWRYAGEKKLPITVTLGLVSGTMMATTSMGGPPVLTYMLAGRDKALTNRANIICYFGVTEIFLLIVMFTAGLVGETGVWRAIILTPPFMFAAWLGSRLFRQSSEQLYRRIALAFLAVVALYGLLR